MASTGRSFKFQHVLQAGELIVPLLLFLVLATYNLALPGLHYDEALEAGLPAVQLLTGQPVDVVNDVHLTLGDLRFPLMVQNHIGAIQVYAALPFIFFGGPSVIALRSMTVCVGVLTVIGVYLFLKEHYGRVAALCGSLWLASFASFVFWSRQGVFVTSLAACFVVYALYFGARWWRTRRTWLIGATGLCLGLAIYSKLSALWILDALVAWLFVLGSVVVFKHWKASTRAQTMQQLGVIAGGTDRPGSRAQQSGVRAATIGLSGVVLGLLPLLLYNARSGSATLRNIRASAGHTYLGVDNSDVLANLLVRLQQIGDVIRSDGHLWYLGGAEKNYLALASVIGAVVILLSSAVFDRSARRSLLFLPFLSLLIVIQSCFTISELWQTHFAVAVTFPAMLVGSAAGYLFNAGLPGVQRTLMRGAVIGLVGLGDRGANDHQRSPSAGAGGNAGAGASFRRNLRATSIAAGARRSGCGAGLGDCRAACVSEQRPTQDRGTLHLRACDAAHLYRCAPRSFCGARNVVHHPRRTAGSVSASPVIS
jgi:hypothetical protein